MLTYPIEWIFLSVLKSFAVPADFQFFSIWHSGRIHRSVKPEHNAWKVFIAASQLQAPCMWPYCSLRFKIQLLTVITVYVFVNTIIKILAWFWPELGRCNFGFSIVNTGSKITLIELRLNWEKLNLGALMKWV